MGRRSINTTKSGKYMNPTDQARKEARKQELKKNKKQRQLVRAAVLKGKDPQQLLEELEKIDQMEYNVNQPSPLNEKVLRDKRKKLRDTLERVLSMYYKDDQEKWTELRKRQNEYEAKRNKLVAFFESVRSAQSVTIDEIPLPQLPQTQIPSLQIPLPLLALDTPPITKKSEHVIYSIATALKMQALGKLSREPPGCPIGPPPDIDSDGEVEPCYWPTDTSAKNSQPTVTRHSSAANSDDDIDDIDDIDSDLSDGPAVNERDPSDGEQLLGDSVPNSAKPKPTSLQQKMVALSGQNVDEFMREMEEQQAKLRRQRGLEAGGSDDSDEGEGGRENGADGGAVERRVMLGVTVGRIDTPAPPGTTDLAQLVAPIHGPQLRPPPPPFGFPPGVRLPPGPPPGRPPLMPPGPPPGLPPPRMMHPPPSAALRIQPPPPAVAAAAAAAARLGVVRIPGPPPMPSPTNQPVVSAAHAAHAAAVAAITNLASATMAVPSNLVTPNVLSAAPQLLIRLDGAGGGAAVDKQSHSATISAKPQIRNLSADVTRFVPSALRVKRDNDRSKLTKAQTSTGRAALVHELKQKELAMMSQAAAAGVGQQPTKDDAYMQFMKEMQGLL